MKIREKQVALINRMVVLNGPIKKVKQVKRNEPCPCGSGKKFKKCCGFNTIITQIVETLTGGLE